MRFRKRTIFENILRSLPSYRAKQDAKLKEAIRWLVEHPEASCTVEGQFIPNGYGSQGQR